MPATYYKGVKKPLGWEPTMPEGSRAGPPPAEDEEQAKQETGRVNASFVVLARNSDVWGTLDSIRGMEVRFFLLVVLRRAETS